MACRWLLPALFTVVTSPSAYGARVVVPVTPSALISKDDPTTIAPPAPTDDGSVPAPEPTPEEDTIKEELRELSKDPMRLSKALFSGMEAMTAGVGPLLDEPPDYRTSTQMFDQHLWEVVLTVVPARHHMSTAMTNAKVAWDNAFASAPDIIDDVMLFKEFGDTSAIVRAVVKMASVALDAAAKVFLSLAQYFEAVLDVVEAVGQAWVLHTEGDTASAVQTIWIGVKTACDEVVAPQIKNNRTYNLVMGSIDGVVAELNRHVLEFKRRLLTSKVCYKRQERRRRVRPNLCHPGFEWDGVSHCAPNPDNGADCWEPCGKQGGWCPSFCGEGKVCCKQHSWWDPPECKGSKGYKTFNYTIGRPTDYHQCVRPSRVVSLAQVSEASKARSLDSTLLFKSGRKYGYHLAMCDPDTEFADQDGRWCMAGCPDGYGVKGASCEQDCGGKFPVDAPGPLPLCGTSQTQLTLAAVEMLAIMGNSAVDTVQLSQQIQMQGAQPEQIAQTINSFIELGTAFARPMCPVVIPRTDPNATA